MMSGRRVVELLIVLGLVAGGVLWMQMRPDPTPPKEMMTPTGSPTPRVALSGLQLSVNGVSPGMTLSQVEQLLGPSLTPISGGGDLSGSYDFGDGTDSEAQENPTRVEINRREKVVFVHGGCLELDGQPIAKDFFSLTEEERAATLEGLEAELGPLKLESGFGGSKAQYPEHQLQISLTKAGAWVFELGESEASK